VPSQSRQRLLLSKLSARTFEQLSLSTEDVRVAIHTLEWKRLKLLPALRTTLVEEPHAVVAWTPGLNFTPSATSTGPKSRYIAAETFGAFVPETLEKHGGANDDRLKSTVQIRGSRSSGILTLVGIKKDHSFLGLGPSGVGATG
jgi:hypothetical protein